jgi:hypothetical protein
MQADPYRRYAYVVLGMHRSGTSALSGALCCFGADGPKTPMRPTEDNPSGYFESTPVKVLNDRILHSAGTRWDDWTRIPGGWFEGPRAAALKEEAKAVIQAEFGASPLFVFKDPRICRIWPFWQSVLTELGITPIPILLLRDPEEVAASLVKRDGMAESLARLIWLNHLLEAERSTRGKTRVITTFDRLLSDWPGLMSEIEAASGFTLPRRSPGAAAEVRNFLDPGLRRNRHERIGAPDMYQRIFEQVAALAADEKTESRRRLDEMAKGITENAELIFSLARPLAEATRQLADADAKAAALEQTQQALDEARALAAERSADADALRRDIQRAAEERQEIAQALADARSKLADSQDALVDLGRVVARVQDEAVALRDEVQRADAAREEAEEMAQSARAAHERDRAAALAEREAAEAEKRKLAAAVDAAERKRDNALTEAAKTIRIAQEREVALQKKARESVNEERQRVQNEFRQSPTWRLTRPLRWLGRIVRRGR